MHRNYLVVIVNWILLAVVFAGVGILMLNWAEWRHLAKAAVETTGTVTGKETEQHRFVRYSFVVDGHSYSGLGNAGDGNPAFEQLQIGSSVKVFYDPSDPQKSFLGNPKRQSNSITNGVIFLALVGSTFSVVGLYFKGWLPFAKRA